MPRLQTVTDCPNKNAEGSYFYQQPPVTTCISSQSSALKFCTVFAAVYTVTACINSHSSSSIIIIVRFPYLLLPVSWVNLAWINLEIEKKKQHLHYWPGATSVLDVLFAMHVSNGVDDDAHLAL